MRTCRAESRRLSLGEVLQPMVECNTEPFWENCTSEEREWSEPKGHTFSFDKINLRQSLVDKTAIVEVRVDLVWGLMTKSNPVECIFHTSLERRHCRVQPRVKKNV
jgi:hypothetical protein